MAITVKFVGALRHAAGAEKLSLDIAEGFSMRKLLGELTRRAPELKRSLINQHVGDAELNALVLVNGREISVLGGLNTAVKDGDEVVFVSVVHGG
ncbi:MAG: MoaD/ThiS family protein [Candidatus Bathyarchaeota archaeon]|nr:MoaD/ThiS family protein [Candidatus Bathyarchaeota archaeon]